MFHALKNAASVLLLLTLLLTGLLSLQIQAAHSDPGYARSEQIVVFGDSLSDTGNKHAVRGLVNEAPYDGLNEFGIPTDPYVTEEGIYFSNGPIWIEAVGAALGDFDSSAPVSGRWPYASNYAWGGARAVLPLAENGNQHLGAQVTAYLDDVGHQVDADRLHVLFIGGNDMVDALVLLREGAAFHEALARVTATVTSVEHHMQRLIDAGAHRFLLLNVPDVGLIPAIQNPTGKGLASCFAELANLGETSSCPGVPFLLQIPDNLASVADRFTAQGLEVTQVDTFAFIRALAGNPSGFGFSNAADSCVTPLVAPYDCADPNAYLFWDGLHPTEATHRLLAALVLNRLGH